MPYGHRVLRYTLISSSVTWCVCVILVRQFVHLTNYFFSATQFNHGLSESCITDEPIVNAQEFSLLAFLLELIRDEVLAMTVGSTFPDVAVGNRKEVKSELDVLLVLFRIISQEVTARAVNDADVSVRQTSFALCIRFNTEWFTQFSVSRCFNHVS